MRKLTFLVVILAALYGGYWFVGSRAIENGARQGLADLRADGWDVRYTDLATAGFPSRFDTTATDLSLRSPDGLTGWDGPFVQVFALSYQPNKVIAALPQDFVLTVAGDDYAFTNDRLRASGAVRANSDLALSDITLEADQLAVTSTPLGQMTLNRGLLALRAVRDMPNRYDAYLELTDLAQNRPILMQGQLPDRIERFVFDGAMTFDRPLDRHGFDGSGPEPALREVDLRNMALDVADMSLTASGKLTVDALGVPDGRITFRTAQWRQLIDYLVAFEVIDPGMQRTVTNVAQAMAAGGGELALPLSFQNGFMSIGPLPLGPAPRLR